MFVKMRAPLGTPRILRFRFTRQLLPRRAVSMLLCAAAISAAACGVAEADGGSAARPPSILVRPIGDAVVVFRKSADGCDRDDIPDAPARALRLADGSVAMIAANQKNRVLRGANLLSVRPDCTVVFAGRWAANPAAYDDRLWLASIWTGDGTNVIALVHSEYQGNRHPGQCPSGRYIDCWYNAITLATSLDGAHSFTRASGGAHWSPASLTVTIRKRVGSSVISIHRI